jgi:hypothetical protein
VVLDAQLTAGQGRAGQAHELEIELARGRLGHAAHPQPRRAGLVRLLPQHVPKPVIDGVHRHQAGRGDRVGDHGGRGVAEACAEVGLHSGGQPAGADETGRRQGHAQRLRGREVLAGEDGGEVEADVLELVGEGVAAGVEGGGRERHDVGLRSAWRAGVRRSPGIVAAR